MSPNISRTNLTTFFLLLWILLLGSINAIAPNFADNEIVLPDGFFTTDYFLFLLHSFRFFIPLIIIGILVLFCFRKKISIDLYGNIFIIYSVWQIFLYLYYKKYFVQINGLQLCISLICVILIMNVTNNLCLKKFYKNALIVFLSIIFLYSFYYMSSLIIEFIKNENMNYLYSSFTLEAETQTLKMANPRITGIARSITILFFFIFFYNLNNKNKFFIFVLILFSTLIYASQSRGAFVGMLTILIIYTIFFKDKIANKIKLILILFILPILLWHSIVATKSFFNNNKEIFNNNKEIGVKIFQSNRIINKPALGASYDLTSGRKLLWKNALRIIKEKKLILGFGPQADRIYLIANEAQIKNDQKNFWVNNVSNVYLYFYLCGGMLGLILIIIINYLIIKKIFQCLFIAKLNKLSYVSQFSCVTIAFLGLRGFFENSYGHFGIDFCLMAISYYILSEELAKMSINNFK